MCHWNPQENVMKYASISSLLWLGLHLMARLWGMLVTITPACTKLEHPVRVTAKLLEANEWILSKAPFSETATSGVGRTKYGEKTVQIFNRQGSSPSSYKGLPAKTELKGPLLHLCCTRRRNRHNDMRMSLEIKHCRSDNRRRGVMRYWYSKWLQDRWWWKEK